MEFDTKTSGTWGAGADRVVSMIYLISTFVEEAGSVAAVKNLFNTMYAFFTENPELPEMHAINLGALVLKSAESEFPGEFPAAGDVVKTLCLKQFDYGPENVVRFGAMGIMVRLHDKIARLENLKSRAAAGAPVNETILDNWVDLVGYCAILAMWNAGEFTLPLTVAESNSVTA